METRADSPSPARSPRGRALPARISPQLIVYLALWATLLLLLGCGSSLSGDDPSSSSLVAGERAASPPSAQLASAAKLAQTFGADYARSIYMRHPPALAGATASVSRQISAGAGRVPPQRRSLRPRPRAVQMRLAPDGRVLASVVVIDGRSRPFSLGFTLERLQGRWRVVSVSAPE